MTKSEKQERLNPLHVELMDYEVQLENEDYKIIKCMECNLIGEELPYDIEELHLRRQNFRDLINETQEEIEELNNIIEYDEEEISDYSEEE